MVAAMSSFLNNASPYGSFAEARKTGNKAMHVAGDLEKGSIDRDVRKGLVTFRLKDQDGQTMQVVYQGSTPSNLAEANRVVAIGEVKGDTFVSDRLLVKCPSKYESEGAKPQ